MFANVAMLWIILKYYFKLDSFASSNFNIKIILGDLLPLLFLAQLYTLRKVGYLIEVKLMEN